jgi:hypothetical protein
VEAQQRGIEGNRITKVHQHRVEHRCRQLPEVQGADAIVAHLLHSALRWRLWFLLCREEQLPFRVFLGIE